MRMNEDQKAGALVIVIAITLIVVMLLLSNEYGKDGPLALFAWVTSNTDDYGFNHFTTHIIWFQYAIAPLVLVIGYGVALYFSLVPKLFSGSKIWRQIKAAFRKGKD